MNTSVLVPNINTATRTPFGHKMLKDTSRFESIGGVMAEAGLDYTVEKVGLQTEPIITPDGVTTVEMPDHQAIVRWHNNRPIPFTPVGNGYTVIQNADAFAPLEYLWDEGFIKHIQSAGTLNEGRRAFMLAELSSTSMLADPHERYILVTTTHDGTGALIVRGWSKRLACSNQIPAILRKGSRIASIRHTANAALNVGNIRSAMLSAIRDMDDYDRDYQRLLDTPMHYGDRRHFVNTMFSMPENATPRIEDRVNSDRAMLDRLIAGKANENILGTGAALFQAAVEWHDYHSRGNRGERIIKGADIAFKTRAFAIANRVAGLVH